MGAISDFPINSALFALKSAVLSRLAKAISVTTKDITGDFSFTNTYAAQTVKLTGTAAIATINTTGWTSGQWINFQNVTGNRYVFASNVGITSSGSAAVGDSSGKLALANVGDTCTAWFDGTHLNIVGKMSA